LCPLPLPSPLLPFFFALTPYPPSFNRFAPDEAKKVDVGGVAIFLPAAGSLPCCRRRWWNGRIDSSKSFFFSFFFSPKVFFSPVRRPSGDSLYSSQDSVLFCSPLSPPIQLKTTRKGFFFFCTFLCLPYFASVFPPSRNSFYEKNLGRAGPPPFSLLPSNQQATIVVFPFLSPVFFFLTRFSPYFSQPFSSTLSN